MLDTRAVHDLLVREAPDVVINATGKTGRPNVDWCEEHREMTLQSNVIGALNVAVSCAALGAHLVHLGSGCVFNGPAPSSPSRRRGCEACGYAGFVTHGSGIDRVPVPCSSCCGWREDDYANPEGFYARTKYATDLVLEKMPHVAIVRLRMPIDGTPHPRNLITKLAGQTRDGYATRHVQCAGNER